MKKLLFAFVVALLSAALSAQQIAVVSASDNATTLFMTLDEAIAQAAPGSTIYLPGGGFQLSNNTKIDKKLTIIGVTHKADGPNSDGNTVVSGNLQFTAGSSGSAVMGIYLHGNVRVGIDDSEVSNILVRYCNVHSFDVNSKCYGLKVNQCYIRYNYPNFGNTNAEITYCITANLLYLVGGVVRYNIIDGRVDGGSTTTISNNICSGGLVGENCRNNQANVNFNDAFEDWQGIRTTSNLHFKEGYEGRTDVGIYAGSHRFSDDCMPPMPHIVSKSVAEQTDTKGMLRMQVIINN